MNRLQTRAVTSIALFTSMGVLLPMAFHALGLGKVFLPMHVPVLLAGILAGPLCGSLTGIITPILSAVLTGMPALVPPVAQMMVFELGVYGLVSGVLSHQARAGVVLSLIGAMFGGRLVYGLLAAFVLPMFGFKSVPVLYPLTAGIASSLPGVALHLVLVPTVVSLARRGRRDIW